MTKEQRQVATFMRMAEQDVPPKPALINSVVSDLRISLLKEECAEFEAAIKDQNLTEIADALGDMLYVLLGAAVAYGIDLEPVFQEIHRSNVSKFIDGHRRDDGKWIKGPSYSPANLKPLLIAQGAEIP